MNVINVRMWDTTMSMALCMQIVYIVVKKSLYGEKIFPFSMLVD